MLPAILSLIAIGFSIATFVWSRRIDREIDTYPYGDVPYVPEGWRRPTKAGRGSGHERGSAAGDVSHLHHEGRP
jgi:hypothetical protein